MPETPLKKASSSYQKGGSKFEARYEGDSATRYKKASTTKKEVRKIKHVLDTTDAEGRPVSDEYEYELESPRLKSRPSAKQATGNLLKYRPKGKG